MPIQVEVSRENQVQNFMRIVLPGQQEYVADLSSGTPELYVIYCALDDSRQHIYKLTEQDGIRFNGNTFYCDNSPIELDDSNEEPWEDDDQEDHQSSTFRRQIVTYEGHPAVLSSYYLGGLATYYAHYAYET